MTDREYLMAFIRSLSLADHMGDVGNTVITLFELMEINTEWRDLDELSQILEQQDVPYLYEIEKGE